jgi:hypothetical protein
MCEFEWNTGGIMLSGRLVVFMRKACPSAYFMYHKYYMD